MSESYIWTSLDNMSPLDSWYYRDKFGARFYNPKDDRGFQTEWDANDYVHSFRTFGLLPAKKPVISPAKPKINIVSLEGASTSIDFTESLTGRVEYSRRQGTFRYVTFAPRKYWDDILKDVSNALNGKRKWVFLDETPDWFYDGRMTVGNPEYENDKMYITVTGDFEPFKKSANGTYDRWRWDPFNLNTGVIYDPTMYHRFEVEPGEDSTSVSFEAGDIPSTFKITVSYLGKKMSVKFNEKEHEFGDESGEFVFYDFLTRQGTNTLVFSNSSEDENGVIYGIDFRELSL